MTSVAPSTAIDRAAARRRFRIQLASTSATLSLLTLGVLGACADGPSSQPVLPLESRADAGVHRQYGVPVKVGEGRARTYVTLERRTPIEVGVALDERALDGLPSHGSGHGAHGNFVEHLLRMPAQNPTQVQFVELDWNPAGHEPPGIYDTPHFDFHFYNISLEQRNAIDPSDPQWAQKAGNFPDPAVHHDLHRGVMGRKVHLPRAHDHACAYPGQEVGDRSCRA